LAYVDFSNFTHQFNLTGLCCEASMKVSKTGGAKDARSTSKKGPVSNSGEAFSESLKSTHVETTPSSVVGSGIVGKVDALFSLQEVSDAIDPRSQKLAIAYGEDLLRRLDELKLGVLNGGMPKEQLTDLAQYLRQKRQSSGDLRLNDIISEIELRAEVEIAKLSRRANSTD
jgi:hypothetical protein